MIQNHIITKKLKEKTNYNPNMKSFIDALIEKELEGNQHTKVYTQLIEKHTKEYHK